MIISCLRFSQILFKYYSNTVTVWILQTYNVTMYLVNSYQLSKISHVTIHYGSRSTGLGTTDWYRKAWPHTLPKLLLIQVPSHLSWQTSQTFGPRSRDDIEWVWAAWLHLATDHERVRKSPPFALGHPHTEGCEGRRRRFGSQQLCRKPLQRQSEVAGVQLAVLEGHVGGLIPSFPPDHGSQTTTGEYLLCLQVNARNYWLREAKTVEHVN